MPREKKNTGSARTTRTASRARRTVKLGVLNQRDSPPKNTDRWSSGRKVDCPFKKSQQKFDQCEFRSLWDGTSTACSESTEEHFMACYGCLVKDKIKADERSSTDTFTAFCWFTVLI